MEFSLLIIRNKTVVRKRPGTTPVGLLLVVALSFLVFYPAGWAAAHVGKYFNDQVGLAVGASTALAIQYVVDAILVLMLAQLYQRFEVSQDA